MPTVIDERSATTASQPRTSPEAVDHAEVVLPSSRRPSISANTDPRSQTVTPTRRSRGLLGSALVLTGVIMSVVTAVQAVGHPDVRAVAVALLTPLMTVAAAHCTAPSSRRDR